jgi:hypothetical protein
MKSLRYLYLTFSECIILQKGLGKKPPVEVHKEVGGCHSSSEGALSFYGEDALLSPPLGCSPSPTPYCGPPSQKQCRFAKTLLFLLTCFICTILCTRAFLYARYCLLFAVDL